MRSPVARSCATAHGWCSCHDAPPERSTHGSRPSPLRPEQPAAQRRQDSSGQLLVGPFRKGRPAKATGHRGECPRPSGSKQPIANRCPRFTRTPVGCLVEVPGIEPGSFGVKSGLLRAQPAFAFLGPSGHASKPLTGSVAVRFPSRSRDRTSWLSLLADARHRAEGTPGLTASLLLRQQERTRAD